MGTFTASMTPTYPKQINTTSIVGDNTGAPGDAAIDCIRMATATGTSTGGTVFTNGGVMVGTGKTSYLSHGVPYFGSCPLSSVATPLSQSSIGFSPSAPTQAVAGQPFLLGQVSHQNWVIKDQRNDGQPGDSFLYGNLNVNFGGAAAGSQADTFQWTLDETVNNATIEKDANGNPLYLWIVQDPATGKYSYSLQTTPQYPGDQPSPNMSRDAQGNPLYYHFYYDVYTGTWETYSTLYTTPDPGSVYDRQLYAPVFDDNGYVDDITQFKDVRSTKIFTTSGGMPYRLVIHGFTPSDGTPCPDTPPSSGVTSTFVTKENQVTYGCLYASWEQERPVVVQKQAENLSTATTPAIPSFGYDVQQYDATSGTFVTPTAYWSSVTGWNPFNLQPTGFGPEGLVSTSQRLLVPIDGVRVQEAQPVPALTSTQPGWKLTSLQCVQGPATQDPNNPSVFTPAPVDWSQAGSATFPLVLNSDGSPIRTDPATGQADLSGVPMADSTATLAVTCRYVNTYDDVPAVSVQKSVSEGQPNPVTPTANGDFTVSYDVTVTNSSTLLPATYSAITDTPGFAHGVSVTSVTVDGVNAPISNGSFQVSAGGDLPPNVAGAGVKTFKVVVSGKAALDTSTVEAAGQCKTDGAGTPGSGLFNQVAMANDADGPDNNDACVPVVGPSSLMIKKYINGDDAESVPGVEVAPGSTMDVAYVVTNSGTQKVSGITIDDQVLSPSGVTVSGITADGVQWNATGQTAAFDAENPLLPGYSVIFRGTAPAPAAGVQHSNTATATGTVPPPPGSTNPPTSVTSNEDHGNAWSPSLTINKQINGVDAHTDETAVTAKPGDTVQVSFVVTNTSKGALANVKVADKVTQSSVGEGAMGPIVCESSDDDTIAVLAAGASETCTTSFVMGTGTHVDAATATVPPTTPPTVPPMTPPGVPPVNPPSEIPPVETPPTEGHVKSTGFKVEKIANTGPITLGVNDTTTSARYTVTVTNTGAVAGTSAQVVDLPATPTGFTITSVTVDDGTPLTAAPYVVTAGDTLAAGASKAHTVVVNYAVDQTKVTDWPTVGECDTATTNPDETRGLFNKVTMDDDSDGADNNHACVPVSPTSGFAVAKTTSDGPATLGAGANSLVRHYTVTVSNTSHTAGTSPVVTDMPAIPAGFAIASVTVDGESATVSNGSFQVSAGDQLAAGASKEHPVVVTFTVDQSKIDAAGWTALGACSTDAASPDKSLGLFNEVDMTGDSDGYSNNHVCTPVTGTPGFSVAKTTTQTPITLAPGATTAQTTYTVTVTNNGTAAGTSAKVVDLPTTPSGFTIASVVVDNGTPQMAADYVVTAGDTLAAGASKAHTVVVNYTVVQADIADWVSLGTCDATAHNPDDTKGLFNKVTMDSDGDGADNNHACIPVNGTPVFEVSKVANTAGVTLKKGDTTATVSYTVTTKNVGTAEGTTAQVVDVPAAPAGFTVASVTVDQGTAQTAAPYVVTNGDQLAAGAALAHTVVVTYTVDQAAIGDWAKLGTCDSAASDPDETQGLFNKVTMAADSDGPDNNHACVPVMGTPVFQVNKTTAETQITLAKTDTSFTVSYTVTVENVGNVAGTSASVTDSPVLPAGFTVAGVVVDGGAMQSKAPYLVTGGDKLAAGASASHTVTVTYAVDHDAVTQTEWKQLGTCQVGTMTPDLTKGLVNQVAMSGDADGTANNIACVPVEPTAEFSVEKSTTDGPVMLAPGQNSLTRHYTVTVRNTGEKAGTSPQVVDVPQAPAGFTVTSVAVDGGAAQTAAPYQVTSGDQLAVGGSKVHDVVVTYAVDQAKVTDWAKLGACDTAAKGADLTKGLANLVTMDGDSDGVDNNHACTPVSATPQFSVSKSTAQGAVSLGADDTSTTIAYTVTVKNVGPVAGTSAQVVDIPSTPTGFTIASVSVDGGAAQTAAPYVVTTGDQLAPQAKKAHEVVVTYTVDQAKVANWDALGTCDTAVSNPNETKGLFNKVTMDGDTDGADNNHACVPVSSTPRFAVAKTTADGPVTLEVGQTSLTRTYTVTVSNTGHIAGTSAQVVDLPTVPAGFTVTSVVVDRGVAQTEAPYVVTDGDQLAAGATKAHQVEVTFAVDQKAITADGYVALGTCDSSAHMPDSSHGLFNAVTMDGDSDGADNNHACTPVTGTPAVKIIKYINGDDANDAPGVEVAVGSTMHITYQVTNTGSTPLVDVKVTDDKVADAAISCPKDMLAVGESMTCVAELPAPAASSHHVNTGTATGYEPTPKGGLEPKRVTSTDKAHAHTPGAPVPPPAPKVPIARTGSPVSGGLLGLTVLSLGLGAVLVRRKR